MTISTNHHDPDAGHEATRPPQLPGLPYGMNELREQRPRSIEAYLMVFDGESNREAAVTCVLTPAALFCEFPAYPQAGIQHYPPDQPIARVLEALLAARCAETETERQS